MRTITNLIIAITVLMAPVAIIKYSNINQKEANDFYYVKKEVNMRNGPGRSYRKIGVFKTPKAPVKVLRHKFNKGEPWVKIIDHQGNEGWVMESLLNTKSKKRYGISRNDLLTVCRMPLEYQEKCIVIAEISNYRVFEVLSCPSAHSCRIKINNGITGWIKRSQLWG